MEPISLPLDRGGILEMELPDVTSSPLWRRNTIRRHHANSAQSLSPRTVTRQQQLQLMRRVSSYQDAVNPLLQFGAKRNYGDRLSQLQDAANESRSSVGESSRLLFQEESSRLRLLQQASSMGLDDGGPSCKETILEILVNLTSGVIAFLLSSTLTVSCASVIVGHGTPLATVIAHFIDMNLLGTAILSLVLAWQSQAPWTLGAIDVFVAPIMASMADKITLRLDGDLDLIVPTTVMMVAMTSLLLGLVFFFMGIFRVTSIANYMPYPVIAGFLSGIGAELLKNGIHMASSDAFTMEFFTLEQQLLIIPAIVFAGVARLGQHLKWPVAISFPCLLVCSLVGFQLIAYLVGLDMYAQQQGGWVFSWSEDVIKETPMWYPWTSIDLSKVQWRVLTNECFDFVVSLVILGAMKYSVATTSLSTLFGREISPDNEMRVIGLANMISGALGCCGGCHYLSAMGIMKQFDAHEKVPAVVCAFLLIALWVQGIQSLQYVPKFIFGGLLLSVGLHFLEAYFMSPFRFLKPLEKAIVLLITTSFLVIGMLPSVGLGIVISMIDLIYRIHEVGCVHHETTGMLSRSSVDRTPEQAAFLDTKGSAIFVLRLQGYLFFGTSVNILERIETRVQSLDFPKLKFVVIDFGLVPSFDATALMNFRKTSAFADLYMFDIYFCGLKPPIEMALRRHHASSSSTRVHFLSSSIDVALETCENALLPPELLVHTTGTLIDWKRMSQLQLWEHYICLHDEDLLQKLLPLSAYLDVVTLEKGQKLCSSGVVLDTYFICFGFMNVMADSEFSNDRNIPGVNVQHESDAGSGNGDGGMPWPSTSRRRKLSLVMTDEAQWTPFTTAESRLRKIGPGSIVTPDSVAHGYTSASQYLRYIATSDCILLRLSTESMATLENRAPHTAVEILKLINMRLASRFLHTNKRVSQLSSLLYK
ncbi:Sulfate permease, partial [Globisporangium splendens]